MKDRRDVIVVGAGPSGSTCAKFLAERGINVLLLEKHAVVGFPLCCAEGISYSALTSVLVPRPDWISSEIRKALLVSPKGVELEIKHPKAGFVLNRKLFDRDLASMAQSAGAELKTGAQTIGLLTEDNGLLKGVRVREKNRTVDYLAKVIIGADGIESQVGKWAGLDTTLSTDRIESCAQYFLADIEVELGRVEFYLGKDVAPGGYVWVFPKGDGCANVGVGIAPHISSRKAIEYLDQFVNRRFTHYQVRKKMMGGVPVFDESKGLVKGNLLLVGDAGRIVDSLSGAGIYNAILSAKICAQIVTQYLESRNPPISFLENYHTELMKVRGRELRFYAYCRAMYLKLGDEDLDMIVTFLKSYFEEDEEVMGIQPIPLIKAILNANPRILLLARHLVW